MSREHHRSDGTEKHPFINPDAAKRAAKALQKLSNTDVVAYECTDCRNWHVGRTRAFYEHLASPNHDEVPQ